MLLSPHFWLEELVASDIAERKGIDNTPPPECLNNLRLLALNLEDVRTLLDNHAMLISSGYRCKELNTLANGAKTSDHMKGKAADFRCPGFGTALEVCRRIAASSRIDFDQLIYEYSWTHISFRLNAPGRRIVQSYQGGRYKPLLPRRKTVRPSKATAHAVAVR